MSHPWPGETPGAPQPQYPAPQYPAPQYPAPQYGAQPYAPPTQPYPQQPPYGSLPHPSAPFPAPAPPVPPVRCQICGAYPARKVYLLGIMGLIVAFQWRTFSADACRQCGTAMARSLTARTMGLGWWTLPGPFLVLIGLLVNAIGQARLDSLEMPRGHTAAPLPAGPPPWKRPAPMIVMVVMTALVAYFVVSIAFPSR